MDNIKNPVDWKTLLKITNNNPNIAKELVMMFAEELPTLRADINTTFQEENYSLLLDHAHKLHGACCYTGVPQLKGIAAQLEKTLKTNHPSAVNELIQQLNAETDLVLTAIEKNTFSDE